MTAIGREQIVDALRAVLDPEVGLNVVDLGLVYDIAIEDSRVRVAMSMTSPACPLGSYLQQSAVRSIRRLAPAVTDAQVEIVWEPAWSPAMTSEEARRLMGWR